MKKNELVANVAFDTGCSQAEVGRVVESALRAIAETLSAGDEIRLAGFGTFAVSFREGRTGRNPRTGETIQVKASKSVRFRPAKALKEAVN